MLQIVLQIVLYPFIQRSFFGLDDKQNCQLWSEFAISIFVKLQKLTRCFVPVQNVSDSKDQLDLQTRFRDAFTGQLVHTTLTIADFDLSQRRRLFHPLVCYLFCESKHCSFYIAGCMKLEFMKFETVIPFIEHFIKCCTEEFLRNGKKYLEDDKYKKKIGPDFSLKNQRKQMVTYRNSLLIMKHFKGLS